MLDCAITTAYAWNAMQTRVVTGLPPVRLIGFPSCGRKAADTNLTTDFAAALHKDTVLCSGLALAHSFVVTGLPR